MKRLLVLALFAAALCVLPVRADQIIDYTETVVNAPGEIGNFSWTIAHDGFIQPPPDPTYDAQGDCIGCDADLFTSFASVSPPSNGGGCQITGVWLEPDFGPTPVTEFSPLCAGMYDAFSGGELPEVGVTGTWEWTWENPDDTTNYITLTIDDPPGDPASVPEPGTWKLLLCGLGLAWIASKVKL